MTTVDGIGTGWGVAETGYRMIEWGLTVVPCRARTKIPLSLLDFKARAGIEHSDADRVRLEARTAGEWQRTIEVLHPESLAVLGAAQVDADNKLAIELVRELGVDLDGRHWMIRTSKGWRWLFRPPEARKLINVVKNNNVCNDRRCELELKPHLREPHGGAGVVELDLLVNTMAILPPSIHPAGVPYRWVAGQTPREYAFDGLREPPALLLDHWENRIRALSPPRAQVVSPRRALLGFELALTSALAARTPRGQLRPPNRNGWIPGITCIYPQAHNNGDKDPSMAVNLERQAFKCYGCNAHGNLRTLASALNVPVVEFSKHGAGQVSMRGAM